MSEKKGCSHCCLTGCLVFLIAAWLAAATLSLGFWLLIRYAPKDAYLGAASRHCNAFAFEWCAQRAFAKLPLRDDEKKLLEPVSAEIKESLKSGALHRDDIERLAGRLVSGPLPWALLVLSFHAHYVAENPDFSPEERASAKISARRVARGLIEGKIQPGQLGEIVFAISVQPQNSLMAAAVKNLFHEGSLNESLKPTLSADLIRDSVKKMKELAKDSHVPVSDTEINLAPLLQNELKTLVEEKSSESKDN
ncbi:MAG: hypothetical protein A2X49_08985 [Lentisphaerae bacterium GWF2_52_8]|nr:MAG: hypothetical protein A2X49_08985 [Lentisphaerae bacterium GWF2_52_8]